MNAVDTNIIFYSRDPRDPRKQEIAGALIPSLSRSGVLLWQVACEYLFASRKLEAHGLSRAQAFADIEDMRATWTPALPTWATLDRAVGLRSAYGLSHWDSLLVAACLDAGVTTLYSEDFQSRMRVESLRIVNPFE
jgi:predicted nucleic acid-binding protein